MKTISITWYIDKENPTYKEVEYYSAIKGWGFVIFGIMDVQDNTWSEVGQAQKDKSHMSIHVNIKRLLS